MTEIGKILTAEWADVPLLLWVGFILLGVVCILRMRRLHFKFKGRDRQLEFKTDNSPINKKE